MRVDDFSERKRCVGVSDARVAYYEEGHGEPLLLVHGRPFSSFVWRKLIALASPSFHCLAPDLLGLGDTDAPGRGLVATRAGRDDRRLPRCARGGAPTWSAMTTAARWPSCLLPSIPSGSTGS